MKKILIADDAAFMRLSLKTLLEKNGFKVIGEAKDGVEAVEKFNLLKPDILTLDIAMPIMNGIEVLNQINVSETNAKVLMISSMGQESIVRKAVMAGAIGFIIKPFNEATVIKAFSKL